LALSLAACAPPIVSSAAVATELTFMVMLELPLAASETLRVISLVVADCSSTAPAIVF
jgi:hypothetical protein